MLASPAAGRGQVLTQPLCAAGRRDPFRSVLAGTEGGKLQLAQVALEVFELPAFLTVQGLVEALKLLCDLGAIRDEVLLQVREPLGKASVLPLQ